MSYGQNNTTKKKQGWNVTESKIRPELDPRNRVDLIPEEFDRLIKQKGIVAKIYRTTYCPNVKSVDGAEHEIDCELCNGSGFIDLDPICTHVFIQTQELDKMPQIEGFVDGNTVLMTFPIGVEIQYFTKIELHDFTDIFPQRVLRKPQSLTDVLKYPSCRVNVLIDKNGKRYYQDQDFALDHNGNIKWLTPGDQQKVTFSLVPDAGAFTLIFGVTSTSSLAFNATAAQVQTALRAIMSLENVLVSGDFTQGFTVTFSDVNSPVALLTSTDTLTSGGNPVTITVTDNSAAAKKPNNNQPYSIHYEAKVQYRARAAVHANRFTQFANGPAVEHIKMPEQWYCTKEFLIKRTDLFTGDEIEQGPYDKHTITGDDGVAD